MHDLLDIDKMHRAEGRDRFILTLAACISAGPTQIRALGGSTERPLDHLGRPRTKTDGGIILYTRQEVARHHPLLPLTPPDRFRGLHRHPLPDPINLSPHHLPMVLKIRVLGP